ncbi:MAG: NB-ARC domain-containing protein, partial [Cyanobacteria bacterium P01_A01_bin.114]
MTQLLKLALFGAVLPLLFGKAGLADLSVDTAAIAQSSTTPASTPQTGSSPQQTATPQSKPDLSKTTLWLLGGCLCAFAFGYMVILWQRPLWLLNLPSEIPLPKLEALPGLKTVPLPIIQWLKYRPQVLDAWVTQRIDNAKAEFEQRETVKERKIHIPLPVKFDGRTLASLEADNPDLRKLFSQQEFRLLIVGEGGVGKTSLVCQISKWAMTADSAYRLCNHRMLPVLVEDELTAIESESPLLDAISLQLKNLRDDEKPVSTELLKHLLEKRRILVIVDHLSEMSEASRKAVRLRDAKSPINALIVTSRVKDILGKEVTQTVLNPLRVSGNQLSIFMDAYLTQRNERERFDDDDYFEALRRLSQIVTDERNITILFAKLYAEQMIAAAAGKVGGELPDNVPDLMLSYLNELNRKPIEDRLPDAVIHRDAKHIAWMCLEPTFRPETADRAAVLEMLAKLETGENAKTVAPKHLNYLENAPLHLIRRVLPAKTRIRFTLDPLAEYLAGLHLVERFRDDTARWQWLLEQAKSKPGNLEDIRGFLLAIRDCCLAKTDCKVPAFVSEELGKLANLDLEAIAREQQRRRIQRLKSELSVPELDDRLRAVGILGSLALHSYDAAAALVKSLDNSEPDVRLKAVNFLVQAGWDTETVAQGLLK